MTLPAESQVGRRAARPARRRLTPRGQMDGCPRQDPAYRPAKERAPPQRGPFHSGAAAGALGPWLEVAASLAHLRLQPGLIAFVSAPSRGSPTHAPRSRPLVLDRHGQPSLAWVTSGRDASSRRAARRLSWLDLTGRLAQLSGVRPAHHLRVAHRARRGHRTHPPTSFGRSRSRRRAPPTSSRSGVHEPHSTLAPLRCSRPQTRSRPRSRRGADHRTGPPRDASAAFGPTAPQLVRWSTASWRSR